MEIDISIRLLPFRDEGLDVLKNKMLCPVLLEDYSLWLPNYKFCSLAVIPTVSSNIVHKNVGAGMTMHSESEDKQSW